MTQPFHFPDGRLANNADDLLELCQQYPEEGTNFLVRHDLEKWLAYIGNYDLAECAANARQSDLEDRRKLEEFLNRSHSLTMPEAVPAAVTESQTGQNVASVESASGQSPEELGNNPAGSLDRATESVDESKDLAAVESALQENQEESIDSSSTPSLSTETPVAESKVLAKVESTLQENSEATNTVPTSSNNTKAKSSDNGKPSFFQVIAKFIVKILYRNKA